MDQYEEVVFNEIILSYKLSREKKGWLHILLNEKTTKKQMHASARSHEAEWLHFIIRSIYLYKLKPSLSIAMKRRERPQLSFSTDSIQKAPALEEGALQI